MCQRYYPSTFLEVLSITIRILRMGNTPPEIRTEYKSGWLQHESTCWVEYLLQQHIWKAVIISCNLFGERERQRETNLKTEAVADAFGISTSAYCTTRKYLCVLHRVLPFMTSAFHGISCFT